MLGMSVLKFQKVPGFLVKVPLTFQESRRSREVKSPGLAERKKYLKKSKNRPTSWAILCFFELFSTIFDNFSKFQLNRDLGRTNSKSFPRGSGAINDSRF